jgi:tRNA A-37 threonylcarbamoyl transferase component Bud32
MEDLTGKTLGQYQITGPLGEGGMASVYKAYQLGMDRYVALKILPRHFASDPQFVKRFEQEAKIIAKLQHPHILPVHDYGEEDGYTYIVMPFVETGTLADVLHGEPLPIHQISHIMTQVGDALDYAHSQGVIHRDVKPSNVLVDERGNCMLTDFGIGKILTGTTQLTRTGDVIGTPAYMSPEQGLGKELDGRSDIYSLGVMLYEMVAGRQPYKAETPMAIIIKHINDPLPPPRVVNPAIPEPVERVVLKALAKDREHRYGTADEMVAALNAVVTLETSQKGVPTLQATPAVDVSTPTAVKVTPLTPPTVRPKRRGNLPWILAGIGGLGVIGVIVIVGFLALANRFWGNQAVDETPITTSGITPLPANNITTEITPKSTPKNPVSPVAIYESHPNKAAYVFDSQDLVLIAPAVQWKDDPGLLDVNQAEILVDPKGEFERVARLSVHGYGHGEQTAWITVRLDVPEAVDIVLIPVATSLNGTLDETDSESGLEISMRDPDSDQESWTYASYLYETQLGVPYVYAFADASPFRGRQVNLMIRLRQIDVCAGSHCTHDADFYIGDLYYGLLPDFCTVQSNSELLLYDYYDDPTPQQVTACEHPLSYYFLDIEDGPYNSYGGGESEYRLPFALPENAELIEFRLYYGYYTRGMTINNHSITPEDVYDAFPQRSGVYLNIPEPSRYSLFNNTPGVLGSYFDWGQNNFSMILYTENPWEERPFDVFMRFKVPVP